MAELTADEDVFPTIEGKRWTANRFRDRVWLRAVEAAALNDPNKRKGARSVFEGFTFHMLRHTAASLMARAGMTAPVIAERLEHSDGGALLHKTYQHLYEDEKRTQAERPAAHVRAALDEEGTEDGEEAREGRNQADSEDGPNWASFKPPGTSQEGSRRPFRRRQGLMVRSRPGHQCQP